jgi:hypothetical protein
MPGGRKAATAVVVIVVLVIIDLVIVGLVITGSRGHDMSIRRMETVEAFYAAEAGMNMAVRELMVDEDQDGDCTIGSISHDGVDATDPGFGNSAWVVTANTAGALTTIRSYGRSGSARRQTLAVVNTAIPSFSDDFEDGVITGWTSIGEDLMVETGGTLRTESGVNTKCHYIIDGGDPWTDYTISADIRSVDNDPAGILFRVQDVNNFYVFRQKFGDGNWELDIEEWVGGVGTELITIDNYGSGPGQIDDANAWYTFKVVISGTNIKGYIDDVLRLEIDDSRYASGTGGLWLWSETDAEFDNVLVEP